LFVFQQETNQRQKNMIPKLWTC